jgi:hypothetical protein
VDEVIRRAHAAGALARRRRWPGNSSRAVTPTSLTRRATSSGKLRGRPATTRLRPPPVAPPPVKSRRSAVPVGEPPAAHRGRNQGRPQVTPQGRQAVRCAVRLGPLLGAHPADRHHGAGRPGRLSADAR